MKQGVLGFVTLISMSMLIKCNSSFSSYEPRGPVFAFGPILGFSSAHTNNREDNYSNGQYLNYSYKYNDKIGHALSAGVIGNVFYKISKERLIGLQCCISRFKLKDFYLIDNTTPTEVSTNGTDPESGGGDPESGGSNPDESGADPSAFGNETNIKKNLVPNGSIRYMDFLIMFKYYLSWTRTSISCGGGISTSSFSPSKSGMKTNLGYVVCGSMEYQVNKNMVFSTSLRFRHHTKKEHFGIKQQSAIKNFNIETGILFSL